MSANTHAQEVSKASEAAKADALAKLQAAQLNALKPKAKIVVVTVPAQPTKATGVTNGTWTKQQTKTAPRTQAQPIPSSPKASKVTGPTSAPAKVVTKPVTVTPAQQPSQTTTGGSKAG